MPVWTASTYRASSLSSVSQTASSRAFACSRPRDFISLRSTFGGLTSSQTLRGISPSNTACFSALRSTRCDTRVNRPLEPLVAVEVCLLITGLGAAREAHVGRG